MVKHLFTFISMLLATSVMMNANELQDPDKVDIKITRPDTNEQNPPRRTPIAIPEVYIDGNTLTFDASCVGCPIALVNEEEEVVYTTDVGQTGIVELPNDLTGTFVLKFVRGGFTFVGEIAL